MHELLLFGQVPPKSHDQVLKILAGIAAMQPQRVLERRLIYKPSGVIGPKTNPLGGSQGVQALQRTTGGDTYYLQLVGDISSESQSRPAIIGGNTELGDQFANSKDANQNINRSTELNPDESEHQGDSCIPEQTWSLQFRNLPDVERLRRVTSRLMVDVEITAGDVFGFMISLGYHCVSEYMVEGHRLIHGNIILSLHRFLRAQVDRANTAPAPQKWPTASTKLPQPLDPSGAWIIQASIRVQDGSKPESITLGTNELLAFKELVKGAFDMDIGERLALDTRVK